MSKNEYHIVKGVSSHHEYAVVRRVASDAYLHPISYHLTAKDAEVVALALNERYSS